jgi:predicted DsbA family dithiol-disulfide isomerase
MSILFVFSGNKNVINNNELKKNNIKMKIEIWSDIVCPFCYIGKTNFENALQKFEHKNEVEIIWKSFQLNPDLKTDLNKTTYQSLSESKGWSVEQTKQITQQVTAMAAQSGLQLNFDKAVVANTFKAHQLIHLAAKYHKQNEMKTTLLKAYFTDGKNIDDIKELKKLGNSIGLNETEIENIYQQNLYTDSVNANINEASKMGINGVPFFLFEEKWSVSGAQSSEIFLKALQHAWDKSEKKFKSKQNVSCTPNGACEVK